MTWGAENFKMVENAISKTTALKNEKSFSNKIHLIQTMKTSWSEPYEPYEPFFSVQEKQSISFFGIMIFWPRGKTALWKIKNGLYFPNHNMLTQTMNI